MAGRRESERFRAKEVEGSQNSSPRHTAGELRQSTLSFVASHHAGLAALLGAWVAAAEDETSLEGGPEVISSQTSQSLMLIPVDGIVRVIPYSQGI